MAHTLPDLPYKHDALEPVIDAETMKLHHGKHHQGYVDKLNKAIKGTEFEDLPIEDLLLRLGEVPEDKREAVRNNGGGHYNHALFWKSLCPPDKKKKPSKELAKAIDEAFGSMDDMKVKFADAAKSRFGSGWAWLCLDPGRKLTIGSTANQDVCFGEKKYGGMGIGHEPILGLDVWEHAYYLKYRNKRADYAEAFWDAVNWEEVSANFDRARESAGVANR